MKWWQNNDDVTSISPKVECVTFGLWMWIWHVVNWKLIFIVGAMVIVIFIMIVRAFSLVPIGATLHSGCWTRSEHNPRERLECWTRAFESATEKIFHSDCSRKHIKWQKKKNEIRIIVNGLDRPSLTVVTDVGQTVLIENNFQFSTISCSFNRTNVRTNRNMVRLHPAEGICALRWIRVEFELMRSRSDASNLNRKLIEILEKESERTHAQLHTDRQVGLWRIYIWGFRGADSPFHSPGNVNTIRMQYFEFQRFVHFSHPFIQFVFQFLSFLRILQRSSDWLLTLPLLAFVLFVRIVYSG